MKIIHLLTDTSMYGVNSYVDVVEDYELEIKLRENLDLIDDVSKEIKEKIISAILYSTDTGDINTDLYYIEAFDI